MYNSSRMYQFPKRKMIIFRHLATIFENINKKYLVEKITQKQNKSVHRRVVILFITKYILF